MISFIQSLLLSDFVIFAVLFLTFFLLTRWALFMLKEVMGYALGWMIGLFFVIVYSSIVPEREAVAAAQAVTIGDLTLSFGQVITPSVLGFLLGLGLAVIIPLARGQSAPQALKVASFTAFGLAMIFLMFVSDELGRRMIGLFTLAFAIGATLAMVLGRGRMFNAIGQVQASSIPQAHDLPHQDMPPPASGTSRLDRIRASMRENDPPN